MKPALSPGDIVFCLPLKARKNDIVVAKHDDRSKIKRIEKIENGKYYLKGDNWSSLDFVVEKKDIVGKVVKKF